ncbi:MAG: Mur ligase family protein, partial [Leptolyngbyaceae bacterium]|nr:Mur ligase family protein [Leptolyngbyaceae bacterium]
MGHAYVIGLGKSGIAAAQLLKREGWQVTVSDSGTSPALQEQQQTLATMGITVSLGDRFNPELTTPELIVVSPGVPWDIPGLNRARELGIDTIGEMELAWRYLQHCPWVGITGTNGKTTTTALIAAIFQAAGFHAPAFGNIGYAACEVALESLAALHPKNSDSPSTIPGKAKAIDWAIAELSSYQIEASPSVAPRIGVWTTFTADHLARHRTLEYYYEIKAHLLRQSQQQIFNGDDPYLRGIGLSQWPDACWTSVKGKADLIGNPDLGVYIQDGWVVAQGEPIVLAKALRMPGSHNQQNLLMAVAAARLAGIDKEVIAGAIAAFTGVAHRLEPILTWQGIDFINDSKAT